MNLEREGERERERSITIRIPSPRIDSRDNSNSWLFFGMEMEVVDYSTRNFVIFFEIGEICGKRKIEERRARWNSNRFIFHRVTGIVNGNSNILF